MSKTMNKWYSSWFDTPFYHILYKDRDHAEARSFMHHLVNFLELKDDASILDLACGRGRHSVYLNELGFDATGADLSLNSITYAKQFENDSLTFVVHDMTQPVGKQYDAIFNLFTSFGYFDHEEDNLNTLKAIKKDLKPGGSAVIDFMNVVHVSKHLVAEENKVVEGINFHIKRWIEHDFIHKQIEFIDNGENYRYTETVKMLTLEHFETYALQAGLSIKHTFGDYQLNEFNQGTSQRLILVLE